MAIKRLTVLGVQNLRAAASRYEVPDGGGLFRVVQPSGRATWCVRFRVGGTPRKLTLPATLTLLEARAAAADALVAVERGTDPTEAKRAARAAAKAAAKGEAGDTLRAIAEVYLKHEERRPIGQRLRTIGERRKTFERIVYPALGSRPISGIRRSEITKLLDSVEFERGGRMADEVLGCLRILFDWHARRTDDFASPVVRGMGVTKPKDRVRSRVLSAAELVAVWRAADVMEGGFGPYVQFVLLTACRRNEAARMTYSELSDDGWLIPAARYKTKVDHLIPLSKSARAVLARLPVFAGCPYVFTSDGKHPMSGFSRYKEKLDKAAGVTGWTLHDLRRSSRSLMSAAGCNPDHAERALGHRIAGIRGVYDCHEFRNEKLQVFEALAAHIDRLLKSAAGRPGGDSAQAPQGNLKVKNQILITLKRR